MNIRDILQRAFPGQRTPIPAAAKWMDVDQATIYRWIRSPEKVPIQTRLLLTYLDRYGPLDHD